MAGEQRRLDRWYRPSADRPPEDSMWKLRFLVIFPRLDQSGSRVVTQVDPTTGSVVETSGSDLTSAYQRHHESIRQRA